LELSSSVPDRRLATVGGNLSNEQLVAIILANAATLFGVFRFGVIRAIKYTHLERDVKELQDKAKLQDIVNGGVQKDLKGLSMKIDRKTAPSA
jgi:hypothetical protein